MALVIYPRLVIQIPHKGMALVIYPRLVRQLSERAPWRALACVRQLSERDDELAQRLVLREVITIPYLEREGERGELSQRFDGPRGRFIPSRVQLPRDHGRSPLLLPRQLEDHVRVARVGQVDGLEAVRALELHRKEAGLLNTAPDLAAARFLDEAIDEGFKTGG
jgi:hypothetical protein